jgi:hypothetical protein
VKGPEVPVSEPCREKKLQTEYIPNEVHRLVEESRAVYRFDAKAISLKEVSHLLVSEMLVPEFLLLDVSDESVRICSVSLMPGLPGASQ